MKLLNLGCGNNRPTDPDWINIDNVESRFPDATCPERVNLAAEENYLEHDLSTPMPFGAHEVDGILASHILEHLTAQECLILLRQCYFVLKVGGVIRISVPCPKLLLSETLNGRTDWQEYCPPGLSFLEYALFFIEHKQVLTRDALFAYLWTVGFRKYTEALNGVSLIPKMGLLDNRKLFSVFVEAVK